MNAKTKALVEVLPPILVALLFSVVVALMCRHGAEVNCWDSLCYLSYASSGAAQDLPLHHGVGYAMALRIPMMLFADAKSATLLCNTALGFLFALCLCQWFRTMLGGIGYFATAIVLVNYAVLLDYSRAMSESLFLLLLDCASACFWKYAFGSRSKWMFVLSMLSMAGACLTRYAGVFFCVSTAVCIFMLHRGRRGLFLGGLYAAGSIFPLGLLLIWNYICRGSATNRVAAWHPVRMEELHDALSTWFSWVLPDRLWIAHPWMLFVFGMIVLLGLIIVTVAGLIRRRNQYLFFPIHILGYILFLTIAYSWFDRAIPFDHRMLSPLVPYFVGCTALVLSEHYGRRIGLLMFVCVFLVSGFRGGRFLQDRYQKGMGYYSPVWDRSPTVQYVESLNALCIVYSNGAQGFGARKNTHVRMVPFWQTTSSGQAREGGQDYENMLHELENGALLCQIHLMETAWYEAMFPLEKIVQDAGLEKIKEFHDGVIWGKSQDRQVPLASEEPEDV